MFEAFNIPAFYLASTAVLSTYALGRTTGMVLDCGHGGSYITPVYEGYTLPHAIMKHIIGGIDIDKHLGTMYEKNIDKIAYKECFRKIKEKFGYIAYNYNDEMINIENKPNLTKTYELPDGQIITIGEERFECLEPMFYPGYLGIDSPGIHKLVYDSIKKCDIDIRKILFSNILLSGGSSMYLGFTQRIYKEINKITPNNTKIKIIGSPQRHNNAWFGGSILSDLASFQEMWIDRNEYNDVGENIIGRKCT